MANKARLIQETKIMIIKTKIVRRIFSKTSTLVLKSSYQIILMKLRRVIRKVIKMMIVKRER